MFAVGAGMDPGSIQETQIKVTRTAAAPDKTDLPSIGHAIKQTKAVYVLRRSVALPLPTFSDGGFMQLPIVAPHPLDQVPGAIRPCRRVATDAASIDQMGLLELAADAHLLGQIAVGQMDIRKQCLGLVVDVPADDAHLRRVSYAS